MSLFSKVIFPELERQIILYAPNIVGFALNQLHNVSKQFVTYMDDKIKHNDHSEDKNG